jgi:hypothetical protein
MVAFFPQKAANPINREAHAECKSFQFHGKKNGKKMRITLL